MSNSLGLSAGLSTLVKNRYNAAAKAAGALTFAPSHVAIVDVGGISFQLRYCPGLAKKPTAKDATSPQARSPKPDPFDNPPQALLVAEVPKQDPSHIIVLNKFPIIEHHFILATKRNKQQTARLEEDDLARTYQCLEAWKIGTDGAREDGKLFAFFNSGEHSGASQPHRHLQLLPVEDMKAGCNGQAAWGLLTDEVLASQEVQTPTNSFRVNPSLPFVHFGKSFPPNVSPSIMYQIYSELYDASLEAVKRFLESHPQELQLHSTENDALPISYNLAMTTEGMVICPRRSDGKKIERPDGSVIDTASLNGTVLGGTMMVKNEELFNLLKNDSSKVASLLNSIGLPSSTSNLGSSHL